MFTWTTGPGRLPLCHLLPLAPLPHALEHCASDLLLLLPCSYILFAQAVPFASAGLTTALDLASSLILQTGDISLSDLPRALVVAQLHVSLLYHHLLPSDCKLHVLECSDYVW